MKLFATVCIALCAFSAPFIMAGQVWAWTPLLLAVAGMIHARGRLDPSQE